MENYPDVLDAEVTSEEYNPQDHLANRGKRFSNLLIDLAGYYLFMFVLGLLLGISGNFNLVEDGPFSSIFSMALIYLYYLILESVFGKTLGKFITGTRVVNLTGKKPSVAQIAGRTLSRFIPFDFLSFFGETPIGWHDSLSNTLVVNNKGSR